MNIFSRHIRQEVAALQNRYRYKTSAPNKNKSRFRQNVCCLGKISLLFVILLFFYEIRKPFGGYVTLKIKIYCPSAITLFDIPLVKQILDAYPRNKQDKLYPPLYDRFVAWYIAFGLYTLLIKHPISFLKTSRKTDILINCCRGGIYLSGSSISWWLIIKFVYCSYRFNEVFITISSLCNIQWFSVWYFFFIINNQCSLLCFNHKYWLHSSLIHTY